MKYRKKPVVIEALKWDGTNADEIADFMRLNSCMVYGDSEHEDQLYFHIPTLEGEMRASIGDYVIKGIKGEFYPIKENIFLETYEAVAMTKHKAGDAGFTEEELVKLCTSSFVDGFDCKPDLEVGISSVIHALKAAGALRLRGE